jgi:hypothetical protein
MGGPGAEILPDHAAVAVWERIANGAPLLVIVALIAVGAMWRYMLAKDARYETERSARETRWTEERIARENAWMTERMSREAKWDEERRARDVKWDEARRLETEARERMVREVIGAVKENTETQRKHTEVIDALKDAIDERRIPHGRP